jgi:hypothetical protein
MTRQQLEKKTIAALRSLAKAHSVRLRSSLKKKEIIELLLQVLPSEVQREDEAAVSLNKEEHLESKMAGHVGEETLHDEKVAFAPSSFEIPKEYGTNHLIALVRDPWWIHTYWEVTPDGLGEANRRAADSDARLTLRVYDTTERNDLTYFWDIEIYQRTGNWYIDVGRPDRTYLIDVGMKSRGGLFATIARSNVVRTPPAGPSQRLDEEWWTVEELQEVAASSFDEGKRLPLEPFEKEIQSAFSLNLFSLTLLRK